MSMSIRTTRHPRRHAGRRLAALVLALLLPLAAARAATAQGATTSASPGAATPEALADQFNAAVRAGDFQAAARLMHPDALALARRFVQALAARDASGQFLQQVTGARSAADLAKISDVDLFADFLRAQTSAQPGLAEAMKGATTQTLGHVNEGPSVAHVVYRTTLRINGNTLSKVDVLTVRRDGGRWRALLPSDLEGTIRAMLAGQ